jgi:hypothetical protein
MSLIDKLLEKAKDAALDEVGDGKWFDSLTKELDKQVDGITDDTIKDAAAAALGKLKDHKTELTHLSKETLTVLMTYLASGNNAQAEEIYLRQVATPDDLTDELLKDAKALIRDKKLRDQRIAQFKKVALDIAVTGAKALLPLLLMAI